MTDTASQTHLDPVTRVEKALDHFGRVGEPGYAIFFAIAGIQYIVDAAWEFPDLPMRVRRLQPHASGLIFAAAPILSDAVAGGIAPEDVYSGLGFTDKLLTAGEDGFRADRINYASILAARLTVELHWRALQQRGFPLTRAVLMSRAMNAPLLPDTPIH